MKKTIIISSLIIIAILLAEAYRENLNMEWQRYQQKYKYELTRRSKTDQERKTATNYSVRMRQIVLPELNRSDRCITCHVAMEDYRMSDMPHPLKSHPGDYLDTHDIQKVGCTFCHDGQGRAISKDEAHAQLEGKYWEKPILPQPFIEANCVRCHMNTLAQTPFYNRGKELFKTRGCVACHKVHNEGGIQGPELTDISNASFHMKVPTEKNRDELLAKFHHNVNLAYIYEAIVDPAAQPTKTEMPKINFSNEEVINLMVFVKSLAAERRVMDVGAEQLLKEVTMLPVSSQTSFTPVTVKSTPSAQLLTSSDPPSKGYVIFTQRCVACHTMGEGKRVGPDLKGVAARRDRAWLKKFIQTPSIMFAEKDPIAMKLLEEYKTPMTDLSLSGEEVEEVIKFMENPVIPVQAKTASSQASTARLMGDELEVRQATESDIIKGKHLFQGTQRFFNRGPSCISCHDVRNDAIIGGGILSKDLTTVFSRMGGAGVQAILGSPPFPVMQQAYKDKSLTEDEIFALVSFLEEADKEQAYQQPKDYGMKLFVSGVVGASFLLGLYSIFWYRRKKQLVNKDMYDRQIKSE